MGIYTTSWLYYGALLERNEYERLGPHRCNEYFVRSMESSPPSWILHCPGRCVALCDIQPSLERYGIPRGEFDLARVDEHLAKMGAKAAWDAVSDDNMQSLTDLLRQARDDPQAMPATFILQSEWCSYDGPSTPSAVTHNIAIS